ncbi:MAG: hypothetical protein J7457_08965 [Roseiflexus sp.]|nr:hypothetical protein [Roseiflexus sp.]
MAELEQAVLRDLPIAAGGRAIDAHGGRIQVIDAQDMLVERVVTRGPGVIIAQGAQDIRQAVVGQVGGAQGGREDGVQGRLQVIGPGTDAVEPMVGAREDVGQPDQRDPAPAQAPVIAVRREVGVQDGRQPEAEQMGQQQRHIVNSFRVDGRVCVHVASLPDSSNLVQI